MREITCRKYLQPVSLLTMTCVHPTFTIVSPLLLLVFGGNVGRKKNWRECGRRASWG